MAKKEKEIDDKEMEKVDKSLQGLADYLIGGIKHNIISEVAKVFKPISKSMLEALQNRIKDLKHENRKLAKQYSLTYKNYAAFMERHNREASAWAILKLTLETRIQQLQKQ